LPLEGSSGLGVTRTLRMGEPGLGKMVRTYYDGLPCPENGRILLRK
jgi:hypothetical protein